MSHTDFCCSWGGDRLRGVLARALVDEITRAAKDCDSDLVSLRRHLHRHPELGGQEHRTTAAILDQLSAVGLEPAQLPGGTGVVCDITGSNGGTPRLGLRADIDALPLQDRKQVSYRSEVDGVCHACGHDVHTTILVGVGLVLARLQRSGALTRSVRLVFQPAEEVPGRGATDVVDAGVLDGLEQICALHCDPQRLVGAIGLRAGPVTAATDSLVVTARGPGGHTARPHRTGDVVYALAAVATGLPGLLSRLADPRAGLSVVWGQVHAGASPNAVPAVGRLEGTMRCLDPDVWERFHDRVPELVRRLAAPYGVEVEVVNDTIAPPCVNDPDVTERLREVARVVLGEDAVERADQSLGGEDFAWMTHRVPGTLVRLGVRNVDQVHAVDLHQGTFDIAESAIGVGVRLMSGVAVG